jgi:tripartite-type tricarboxylate transporter receptor subunit TctC
MRRTLVLLVASAACSASHAQVFPSKPVRFVVGFPAGGATDLVARTISQKLGDALGQAVVVDNRPGAASNIGAELVASSPKDGHTMLLGTVSTSINPSLYKKLAYDPLRDFAPVTQVTSTPFVVAVHPSLPVRSVKDLIELAKPNPGKLVYASAGSGSGGHLFVEMFASMARVKLVHVPYKGAAPATTATISCAPSRSPPRSALRPHPSFPLCPKRLFPVMTRMRGSAFSSRQARRKALSIV